jgi:glycosyltransferase involved in cell wall biosynthesis
LLPSKGHDLVLASLAQLDERIRPALLIAAASGDSVERVRLESLAQSLGVQMSIVNVRTTKAMADRYARALVVVAAPVYEALGLSPLEAMACGTPVIVAKVGGLVETVKTGETGMIVERSAAALAGALRTLLEDTVLAERMGQQGRAYVLAQWTWQRAVDRLEGHLEHACST